MSASTLEKIKRAVEQVEQDSAREFRKIGGVVEERRAKLGELKTVGERLRQEVKQLSFSGRVEALRAGEGIGNLNRYLSRLTKRLERLDAKIAESERDLARSVEREQIAGQELREATVEKKKVEQLLEGKARQTKINRAAREEFANDEQQSRWLKDRWRKN